MFITRAARRWRPRFFNQLASNEVRAISAGTQPAAHVHPEVVTIMREAGIDLSKAEPQRLTVELARGATLLITMGCGEQCPVVPGLRRLDWPLQDPKGQSLDSVRVIRDEVRKRVHDLLQSENWLKSGSIQS